MGTLTGAQLEEVAGGREKVIADSTDLKKACPEAALRAFTDGPSPVSSDNAVKTDGSDTDLIGRLKSLGYTQ